MYLSPRFNVIGHTFILMLSIIQQCYGASVHHFLKDYEVLTYETTNLADRHKRTRRSVPDTNLVEHMELHILAFGKNLTLILTHDYDVIHSTARLTVGGVDHPDGLSGFADHMVRGIAANYPNSGVFGSILNGVFRGTIILDHTHPDLKLILLSDSYFVEPASYYFEEITEFHSIIYHASHVLKPEEHFKSYSELFDHPSHFCGLSNPEIVRKMEALTSPVPDVSKEQRRRVKRDAGAQPLNTVHPPNVPTHSYYQSIGGQSPKHFAYSQPAASTATGSKKRVCNLFLQSDTFLWDRVMALRHVSGDKELAAKEITSIFTQHVQSAQVIFESHVFRDHSGKIEYAGVGFRVDHVVINMTDVHCKQRPGVDLLRRTGSQAKAQSQAVEPGRSPSLETYADENPFCSANIDVTNMLNSFSYGNYDEFCAAYVFTYRDFSGGTLGLAFVASPSRVGGVCSKHRLISEGSQNVYKSLNTGLVTLINYGKPVPTQVSQVTFAHELGHNFGCNHDDDYKAEPYGCLPESDDPHGNYIMFSSATNGDKHNNNKFSRCSSNSIATLLDHLMTQKKDCFVDSDGPFCGNKLVEADEECDCGFTAASCTDQCCHPRESTSPCKLVDYVTVGTAKLKVRCSRTAGECCTHDCQFQGKSHMCRSSAECYGASYCTGLDAKCPPSKLLPDGTLCQDATRVCKNGQCTGSLCESIPGWTECSIPRTESVTSEMLCYVSCRENRSNAPCINTFMLQQSQELQSRYPQLTKKLLRNGNAVRMQPGTPCDNYMGYCDAFHRCMSVEAQGPLARLRNLLFSPQVLDRVKTWITVHWWAVILMCLGVIIGMILFVKLCAKHTPMAQSRYPHRARSIVNVNRHGPSGPIQPSRAHRGRHAAQSSDTVPLETSDPGRWAFSREKGPRSHNRKRSKSKAPAEGVIVSSALSLEMDDLAPPPNARQKPLPIFKNNNNNNNNITPSAPSADQDVESTSANIITELPCSSALANSDVITAARKNSRLARSSFGHHPHNRHAASRPVSMFVRTSNVVAPVPVQVVDHHRRRPKLRPSGSRRSALQQPLLVPRSTSSEVVPSEDCVFLPSSACIPIQLSSHAPQPVRQLAGENVPHTGHRNTEQAVAVVVDPSVPPPAYEDLPIHKPVMHRRRSSPHKRV